MRQKEDSQTPGRNALGTGNQLPVPCWIVGGAEELAEPFDAGA
jgi:hypothetical protein